MTGHPCAFVEDFDDLRTETRLELLLAQGVGDGIIVPVDFHVIIDVHADQFPLGILIRLGGQWSEGRTVQGCEHALAGAGEFLERALVEGHQQVSKREMFPCPGQDQAVLFRYFRSIGYDYTHPEIGPEWNSCAGVTELWREGGAWKGRTRGLARDHDVHVVHYWSQFKPWAIDCPLFRSYAWVDEVLRGPAADR